MICPILENGQVKLKCFMGKKENPLYIFGYTYTYEINLNILLKFLQANSYGQAYNGLIKYRQDRVGFDNTPNKEKGLFTKKDVLHTMVQGKTKLLLDITTLLQGRHQLVTNMEQLTERKRKKQLEREFDVFYNY